MLNKLIKMLTALSIFRLCLISQELDKETYIEKLVIKGDIGTKPGQLMEERIPEDGPYYGPECFAIDSEDNIWIADNLNNRIQCFNPEGKYLKHFTIENPIDLNDMALDDNRIYILYLDPVILVYDFNGNLLSRITWDVTKGNICSALGINDKKHLIFRTQSNNDFWDHRVAEIDTFGRVIWDYWYIHCLEETAGIYYKKRWIHAMESKIDDHLFTISGDTILNFNKKYGRVDIFGIDGEKNIYGVEDIYVKDLSLMTWPPKMEDYVYLYKINPNGELIVKTKIKQGYAGVPMGGSMYYVTKRGDVYVLRVDLDHYYLWKYEKR